MFISCESEKTTNIRNSKKFNISVIGPLKLKIDRRDDETTKYDAFVGQNNHRFI